MSALYHLYMNSSIIFACSLISRANRLRRRQDKRASPAADEFVCPCLYDRQEGESTRCFRPHIVCFFLISARIVLYHHRKSGHHLGTKASKIIVLLYASMCKKVSVYNGFHSSRLFDNAKSILFFIITADTFHKSFPHQQM